MESYSVNVSLGSYFARVSCTPRPPEGLPAGLEAHRTVGHLSAIAADIDLVVQGCIDHIAVVEYIGLVDSIMLKISRQDHT